MKIMLMENGSYALHEMTPEQLEQFRWAVIKGADCGMEFCSELLEMMLAIRDGRY